MSTDLLQIAHFCCVDNVDSQIYFVLYLIGQGFSLPKNICITDKALKLVL